MGWFWYFKRYTLYLSTCREQNNSPLIASVYVKRKKGKDMTQSYDKTPTPTEKSKKKRDNTKTPPKTSITQRLWTDLDGQLG